MHPIVILAPAVVLIVAPRLWVSRVLKRNHGREGESALKAVDLARELLDKHGLQSVKVEVTDRGDHYDPQCRAVRLARDKYDRGSLTALTTAAHEVAHAMQHARDYGPFLWRTRLARLAQVTGELGGGLLLAVPVTALVARNRTQPAVLAVAALSVLGTGVAAQLATLPSELDASFNRALPMLRAGYIDHAQAEEAHRILLACSLTYVASSLALVITFWPWIGANVQRTAPLGLTSASALQPGAGAALRRPQAVEARAPLSHAKVDVRLGEALLRPLLKPLIRGWLRLLG